jgi:hypothetical protein
MVTESAKPPDSGPVDDLEPVHLGTRRKLGLNQPLDSVTLAAYWLPCGSWPFGTMGGVQVRSGPAPP